MRSWNSALPGGFGSRFARGLQRRVLPNQPLGDVAEILWEKGGGHTNTSWLGLKETQLRSWNVRFGLLLLAQKTPCLRLVLAVRNGIETEMGGVGCLDSYTADFVEKKKGSWEGSAKVIFEGFLEAVAQTQQVSKRFRRTASRSSESVPGITCSFCLTPKKLCQSFAVPEIQTHAPCRNLLRITGLPTQQPKTGPTDSDYLRAAAHEFEQSHLHTQEAEAGCDAIAACVSRHLGSCWAWLKKSHNLHAYLRRHHGQDGDAMGLCGGPGLRGDRVAIARVHGEQLKGRQLQNPLELRDESSNYANSLYLKRAMCSLHVWAGRMKRLEVVVPFSSPAAPAASSAWGVLPRQHVASAAKRT